jgi:hypothetical protein
VLGLLAAEAGGGVVSATSHVHDWGVTIKVDRCHAIEHTRICQGCGFVSSAPEPRDFTEPGTIAFADPNCATCRKMVAQQGVWPDSWKVVHT